MSLSVTEKLPDLSGGVVTIDTKLRVQAGSIPDLYSPERAEKYNDRFSQLKDLFPAVKIYNCNPQSAIKCFDYADVEDCI